MNKRFNAARIICAAALLIVFGVSAYALTASAAGAYNTITQKHEDNYNLRVAAGFLSMQVRRFDAAGAVSVVDDCLVLSDMIDGEEYHTRIYLDDGVLYESFTPADMPFDRNTGFEITELDTFSAELADGLLRFSFSSGDDTRTMTVALKSGGAA